MFKRKVPLWVFLSSVIIVGFCSYLTGAYLVTSSKSAAPIVEIPKETVVGTNTQLVITNTRATLNTVRPLNTFVPSNTPEPTSTSEPTKQPTITNVPTATVPAVTDTPEPTVNPDLTSDKVEGVWLVGKEVAVGLWRASGDCYAVTQDKSGQEMDMASGSRSIITIPSDAFSVKFVSYPDNCTWSYLGQ